MQVPFIDLRVQREAMMPELIDAFRQVTESSAFAGGPYVSRFETEFAAYCQVRHVLGVGSGTDALWLSLIALGVGHGDEVITVPNSRCEPVVNHTKLRSGAELTFPLAAAGLDLPRALAAIGEEARAFAADPVWQPRLLKPPVLRGPCRPRSTAVLA